MPPPTFQVPAAYRAIPARLNMGAEIVDRPIEQGWGPRPALWHGGGMLSRDELRARVDACARGFRHLGIERGTPYLLRGPNSPALVVAFLAGLKLGALPVLVNSLLGPRELAHIVENSDARVAIVAAEAADPLRALQRQQPTLRHLATIGPGERGEPRLEDLLDDDASALPAADTSRDDPALMVYTSGTTGLPKGIVHSHRWVVAVGDLGVLRADYTPADRVLATGEFSFISALGHGLVWPLRAGASAALLEERAQPEAVLGACERLGATVLFSVPTFYRKVLAMPDGEQAPRRRLRLRYGNSTGEPLGVATYREWKARFGTEIYEYLGISEFQVLTCHGPAVPIRPGSVGVPFPGVDLRVLDADLNEVPTGAEGYLSLRGDDPGLALGYRKNPERWRQMFRDEWYQPGDRFRADGDGYLWYVGREDDFFKSRGMSVAPAEIEAALMELAPVLEAAVVPVPDAEIGYAIKAFVVLRAGHSAAPTLADELRGALRARIAPYKVPRVVEFVEALPHSAQGKVLRRALQA
jgi:acyl-coenzyme A synthetase/AMP-(fatty) acid ligase